MGKTRKNKTRKRSRKRRKQRWTQKLQFWFIKSLFGLLIFGLLFIHWADKLPQATFWDELINIFVLFISSGIADIGGYFGAATVYPRGRNFDHHLREWYQRMTLWGLQALITAFGILWFVSKEIFGGGLLAFILAWFLIKFVCYLVAFWWSHTFI